MQLKKKSLSKSSKSSFIFIFLAQMDTLCYTGLFLKQWFKEAHKSVAEWKVQKSENVVPTC